MEVNRIKKQGLLKKHAAIDYEVWVWKSKLDKIRGLKRVTKNEIQAHALKVYHNAGITTFKVHNSTKL